MACHRPSRSIVVASSFARSPVSRNCSRIELFENAAVRGFHICHIISSSSPGNRALAKYFLLNYGMLSDTRGLVGRPTAWPSSRLAEQVICFPRKETNHDNKGGFLDVAIRSSSEAFRWDGGESLRWSRRRRSP